MRRRNILSRLLMAGIVAIFAAEARAVAGDCSRPPPTLGRFTSAPSPAAIPDQPVFGENGQPIQLSSATGQALVINFWATWCAPCVTEMADLDHLAATLADDGIAVLAVSADREGAPVVRRFFDVNKITRLPVMLDRQSRLARALSVSGLPTTVIYDRTGMEVGRIVGVAQWLAPETVAFLRRCLAAPGAA